MLLENTSKVFLKMIPDQEYENEQKKLEDKMLKEHLRNGFINLLRNCNCYVIGNLCNPQYLILENVTQCGMLSILLRFICRNCYVIH